MRTILVSILIAFSSYSQAKSWPEFVAELSTQPAINQLHLTNRFFNQNLRYKGEIGDRWLLLNDFLNAGEGDCEDFAIGKYQTLLAKGFSPEEFNFIYAIQNGSGQAHIALLHKPSKSLLDSITNKVASLEERTDLTPIIAFTAKTYELFSSQEPLSRAEFNSLIQWQKVLKKAEINRI